MTTNPTPERLAASLVLENIGQRAFKVSLDSKLDQRQVADQLEQLGCRIEEDVRTGGFIAHLSKEGN